MDFVAIDFETANQRPSSACQVAVVSVRDSQIVDEEVWLIRPPTDYFAPINMSVHGIRPPDVADAPNMEQVWEELGSLLDGQTIIAHNARFDVGVLVASLAAFEIACPPFEFQCTRALARAVWPGLRRYGLKHLGNWLGIDFRHHDALEDARCCAQVAIAAQAAAGSDHSLEDLERQLNVSRGFYRNQRIHSPKRGAGSRHVTERQYSDRWGFPLTANERPPGSLNVDSVRQSSIGKPLAGKRIVMLGPLRGFSMDETVQLLLDLGATVQSSIDATTDFVVAAGKSISEARTNLRSNSNSASCRNEDATSSSSFHSSGLAPADSVGIRLLSERQFRALLPGGSISF